MEINLKSVVEILKTRTNFLKEFLDFFTTFVENSALFLMVKKMSKGAILRRGLYLVFESE